MGKLRLQCTGLDCKTWSSEASGRMHHLLPEAHPEVLFKGGIPPALGGQEILEAGDRVSGPPPLHLISSAVPARGTTL